MAIIFGRVREADVPSEHVLEQIEPQRFDLHRRAPSTGRVVVTAGLRICSGIRAVDALGQRQGDEEPEISYSEVTITQWEPEERKY